MKYIRLDGLDFYKNITPNSRRLGQLYFGLDVALTSEQIDNTGLPNTYEYNAKYFDGDGPRTALYPPGIVFGDYLSWLSDTANEFADIAVLSQTYGGLNIDKYMPFVEYQLAWFDEFYQMRNGLESNGSLILYPASGAETYKLALNPSSTLSGLRRTVMDILLTNPNYVKGNRSYYEGYLSRIPATPLHPCPGASGRPGFLQCLLYTHPQHTLLTWLVHRAYLHISGRELLNHSQQRAYSHVPRLS